MDQDIVFKALADTHRRQLLDLLQQRDGRSLSELEEHLPMTRFGVMKHLKILEEAGLITTEKVGREKHHYLNRVPIQMVYDRWVSQYAQPFTSKLTALKYQMENTMSDTITHKYQIFIQTTPDKLWEALTSAEISPSYYFNTAVQSEWKQGSPYTYEGDGFTMIKGEVLEIDPPQRLVQTFNPLWGEDVKALAQSKVTWLIEPDGEASKLTLIHEELEDKPAAEGITEGWARILSSMKSMLETGNPLHY